MSRILAETNLLLIRGDGVFWFIYFLLKQSMEFEKASSVYEIQYYMQKFQVNQWNRSSQFLPELFLSITQDKYNKLGKCYNYEQLNK